MAINYEIKEYLNFGRCVCIDNGAMEMYVTIDIGPRIIKLNLKGKNNMMFNDVDRKSFKDNECLKDGEFTLLLNENDVSVYTRVLCDEVYYIVSRYADTECDVPECVPKGCEVVLNNYSELGNTLKPYQSVWLKKI